MWCADYVAPSMHTEATTLRKQLQALQRRHEDSLKSSRAAAERYTRHCRELGLAGNSLESELQAAVKSLPQRLRASVEALKSSSVGAVADAYAQLPDAEASAARPHEPLPALTSLLHGTVEPMGTPTLEYLGAGNVHDAVAGAADEYGLDGSAVAIDTAVPSSQASAANDAGTSGDNTCADEWGITSVQEGSERACAAPACEASTCGDAVEQVVQALHCTEADTVPADEYSAAASRFAFDNSFLSLIHI